MRRRKFVEYVFQVREQFFRFADGNRVLTPYDAARPRVAFVDVCQSLVAMRTDSLEDIIVRLYLRS